MAPIISAGLKALITFGPSIIRTIGQSKGGATENVAESVADIVEVLGSNPSQTDINTAEIKLSKLPAAQLNQIHVALAKIDAEREQNKLNHDSTMHTQQQETLRSGKDIKTFRPEIASRHSWFTVLYIFLAEGAQSMGYGNGANWELAMLIASPLLAWFGFRTWDKFSKQGASR